MAGESYPRASNWYTPSDVGRTREVLKEWTNYVATIQGRTRKPAMDRPVANSTGESSERRVEHLQELVEFLKMHNIDLHNKLMEVGKRVRDLVEKHPELHNEVSALEAILTSENAAGTSHPIGSSLYRKGD